MAHEWYVQHGGKQYGPLTSANLKKLAADGKIGPTTSVRQGAESAWVPASRVQGLFAASALVSAEGSDARAAPPQVAAPPVALPPPPPQASPLMRLPMASAVVKAARVEPPSLAARILGAVALMFGILALATLWLPILGGAVGWTGIFVGTLGLLVGISAFVFSALRKGSGLALAVAGTSSSAVGLVLSVVFGIIFGLFASSKPVAVAPPVQPPPQRAPTPRQEQPKPEPEPEQPPEPQWFDASQPIEQGNIRATIISVGVEQVALEGNDLSVIRKAKRQPMLKIRVQIDNISTDKIVQFSGWSGGGSLIAAGVAEALGSKELGGAVGAAIATAQLQDNVGNPYPQTPIASLFNAQTSLNPDVSIRPGKGRQAELIFQPPLTTIKYLRLELPPLGFGGEDSLRYEIPKDAITGM